MSDVSLVMVIFLGATLLLHSAYLIPRFALRKSSPEWVWILVDYLWISALLVTLITAAAHARVYFAASALPVYEIRYEANFQSTQGLALDNQTYYCGLADEYWPDETAEAAFRRACVWFTEMTVAMEGAYDSTDWGDFLRQHRQEPPDDDPSVQSDKERAIRSLTWTEASHVRLEEQGMKANLTTLEEILVFLWPRLLALSLALRATKATAELLEGSTWHNPTPTARTPRESNETNEDDTVTGPARRHKPLGFGPQAGKRPRRRPGSDSVPR